MTATTHSDHIRVFISYSHDSDEHKTRVRELCEYLRRNGLDCRIDQYVNGSPATTWLRWMEDQIEDADFVLLICTEKYYERYRGKETIGGLGVNFEGLIISQTLYEQRYLNTKFISIIFDKKDFKNIPTALRSSNNYTLPNDYELLIRYLTNQPTIEPVPIGSIPNYSKEKHTMINYGDLPTVDGQFVGRQSELSFLDKTLSDSQIKIIEFIAAGGTGKTKLLRHWLNKNQSRLDNYFIWSFYSQGSLDDKFISTSVFFSCALQELKSDKFNFSSEEEKADHLAGLLIKNKVLLILDGLEPLQYASQGMLGRLKDRALSRMLKKLSKQHTSICIITTRLEIYDLKDLLNVQTKFLDNLQASDGAELLSYLNVKGEKEELEKAAIEYGCHALALRLLGTAITYYFESDITKRHNLTNIMHSTSVVGQHAFKVMYAYQKRLDNTPELKLLYLISLFNQPISIDTLEFLWKKEIKDLTSGFEISGWMAALHHLEHIHQLIFSYKNRLGKIIDCHPIIREFFSNEFKSRYTQSWKIAHEILYEYYCNQAKHFLPSSLEDMRPLFNAVEHGCTAGLYQQTFDGVYWQRINQVGQHQETRKKYFLSSINAQADNLSVLASFFKELWHETNEPLRIESKANILRSAGFSLRTLGRIEECIDAFKAEQPYWKQLNRPREYDLVEPYLTYGEIKLGLEMAEKSVSYYRSVKDHSREMECQSAYARALHQSGQIDRALDCLKNIESSVHNKNKYLIGRPGFFYCEILIEQHNYDEVKKRAEYGLKNEEMELYQGLNNIFLAIVYSKKYSDNNKALKYLQKARNFLYKTGNQDHILRAFLVRSAIYREDNNFENAYTDLQEVFDIAEPSGMRLHLTDYYLKMSRLLIIEKKSELAKDHIQKATELIEKTGYHRRALELAEIKKTLKNVRLK